MTKTEESVRSMFIAVRDYMVAQTAIWTASAGATTAVTALTNHITKIDTYSMGQQTDTKGVTITKGTKRDSLVSKIIKVANGLVALGNATGNFTLSGQAKVNKGKLDTMPDTELVDKGTTIRTAGNTNIAALADYNILPADITALQNAIAAFNTDIQKPKNTIGQKKTSTTLLKNEFKLTNTHLENVLDPIVRTYNETQPVFVSDYFNSRIIFNSGYTKVPLRFIVDDSVNHLPIANVQILIQPGDIKKKTTEQGNAIVKSLAGGAYTATLSKLGFVTQNINVNITDGETTTKVVSMVAV